MTSAKLTLDGRNIELPVQSPSEGPDVVDVARLVADGYFTYDPGYMSTASCESSITYIDGDVGKLLHRGYAIEELAEQSSYLELAYLLLEGQLPNSQQLSSFRAEIAQETIVSEKLVAIAKQFPTDSHPMGIMIALVGALAAIYHDEVDRDSASDRRKFAVRLLAQIPICGAIAFRHITGKEPPSVETNLSYGEHFLHLMFSDGTNAVDPILARAIDRIFLLHADHEQNASTSTVRLVGSTDVNPYAAIAAGIAALWGPAHGGANEAVLAMLNEIGTVDNIPKYIEKAKDRDDPFRIMGFGHRVYKNYDPRARRIQETAHEVMALLGIKADPVLEIAKELERIALEDEYFVERRLYPNVDFYSGIILKAMGIPSELFTVIFVVGRTSGWIAQWIEMVSASYRIGRPRQLYTGPTQRPYVPMKERG